jgi:hypothetical protein
VIAPTHATQELSHEARMKEQEKARLDSMCCGEQLLTLF